MESIDELQNQISELEDKVRDLNTAFGSLYFLNFTLLVFIFGMVLILKV